MFGLLGEKDDVEGTMFSGHACQDFAAQRPDSEKRGFDLVSCFAPLLDCMMVNQKMESDLHMHRMKELTEVGSSKKEKGQ